MHSVPESSRKDTDSSPCKSRQGMEPFLLYTFCIFSSSFSYKAGSLCPGAHAHPGVRTLSPSIEDASLFICSLLDFTSAVASEQVDLDSCQLAERPQPAPQEQEEEEKGEDGSELPSQPRAVPRPVSVAFSGL